MLKNNTKLVASVIIILSIVNIIHIYKTIDENNSIKNDILMEDAKVITSFFKSFRKTYQDIFVHNYIKITEDTVELLPVKTTNQISESFSKLLHTKVTLRTVSDRPRNSINLANEKEMQIIKEFKEDSSKKYIFKENDNHIYNYYEPLYIKPSCLKCHGNIEDAPKIIQTNYKTAFNYKLNDLRGIISLKINKNVLLTKIEEKNKYELIFIFMNIFILISVILFLYFRLQRNNENSKKDLLSKNKFLEIKAQEFKVLQDAIGISEIISTADTRGVITSVNDKFCEVRGFTREELIGKTHSIVRHPDTPDQSFKQMWATITNKKIFKGILKNKRKDGTMYYVDSTIVPILNENGEIKEYVGIRHLVEDMINHKQLLQDFIRQSTNNAFILVKLEGYEELEDFYTANIITQIEDIFVKKALSYFPKDCQFKKVYKLEHGEFAFIKKIDSIEVFTKEKSQLITKFQQNVNNSIYSIDGYSINISILVSFTTGEQDIYENAKLGLKKLLLENKTLINANGLVEEARQNAQKNINTLNIIKNAINTNNIISHLQPLYNNKTKKIEKYESLVRLVEESGKILSPYFFLDISKKGKYYNNITQIVIDNSFKILSEIKEDISINLSFLDIEDHETRKYFYNYMDRCNNCDRIVIELLEDETAKNFALIQEFIQRAKSKGIKIAIDDFGAGYSNFERLLDFQPDILKIDGSLIKNIHTDSFSRNVVETIQEFATRENIQTVAEFVHNKEIFDIVNEIGIDYTQGYYISEPKSLIDILENS